MRQPELFAALFLGFALCLLAGCGAKQEIADAERAVVQFHQRLDGGEFNTIYNEADPRFQTASPQTEFLPFITAVHTKLGNVVTASRQGFFLNATTSGLQVRLNYSTKFAGGDAQEQFVWSQNGEKLQLLGYHVNSMALIIK